MTRVSVPIETDSSCRAQTLAALETMRAVETAEGQAALALAAGIDSGRALMAVPAMVKELRATLDALRERAPKTKDSVDEFSARRAARRNRTA
jgi:hypothetical protein